MATPSHIANATPIKDVWTITVANTWATSDTCTITIGGQVLIVTVGANVTTAQVATTIKEAFNNNTFTDTTAIKLPTGGGISLKPFAEYTATVNGSVVTLTANTAGISGTISVSETTAGSGTATGAHATSASGPNFFTGTANYDTGAIPTTSDTMIIDRAITLLDDLDQNAITLAELRIGSGLTQASYIGRPFRNANGYEEYREDYFKIGATLTNCRGRSGRIKLDNGSVQAAVNIFSTGQTAENGRPAFQWLGTHASNVVNVYGGDVGIAANEGEVSTVATVRQTAGTLSIGQGATLTTVDKSGGTLVQRVGCTTLTSDSGTTQLVSGSVTTLNLGGGTLIYDGVGTITTLNARGTCTIDLSGNTAACTITTLNVDGDVTINDPAMRLVLTNVPVISTGRLIWSKD